MYLFIRPVSFFGDLLNRASVWGSSALNHLCAVTSVCDGVVCRVWSSTAGGAPCRRAMGRSCNNTQKHGRSGHVKNVFCRHHAPHPFLPPSIMASPCALRFVDAARYRRIVHARTVCVCVSLVVYSLAENNVTWVGCLFGIERSSEEILVRRLR